MSKLVQLKKEKIRVLSLPSYHWYMSKFNDGELIEFVNPDSDFFTNENLQGDNKVLPKVDSLEEYYPPSTYDLVHIHFEYEHIGTNQLEKLLKYFKENGKKIVWTAHDRRSNDFEDDQITHQQLLYRYADKVITLSQGNKKWLMKTHGRHKNVIDVLPHGYIEHPDMIRKANKDITKCSKQFLILLGNFRPNKEYIDSIRIFLGLKELMDMKLKIIFNPISVYKSDGGINKKIMVFDAMVKDNDRVDLVCYPFIEHEIITRGFLESHAIILPYLWGTHSGQVELARDCGCHVVAPNCGFYKEQWSMVEEWNINEENKNSSAINYAKALVNVSNKLSLKPDPKFREEEFNYIKNFQYEIYKRII